MKRPPLKRKSKLTRVPLAPGVKRMRRTRIKRVGKRRERDEEAQAEFREKPHWMRRARISRCNHCGSPFLNSDLHAHHLCSRARAPQHPMLHSTRNRAWLCAQCHDEAHRGLHPELIKSRDFLDSLQQETI